MRKRVLRALLGTGYVVLLTALLLYQAGVFGGRREWAVAVFGTLALGVALAVVLALYMRVSEKLEEQDSGWEKVREGYTGDEAEEGGQNVSAEDDKKHDNHVRNLTLTENGNASACGDSNPAPQSYEEMYAHFLAVMEGRDLSERELEVAWLLYRGYTNRQIGESLYIAETTVKKHVSHIYQKADVCSRKEFRATVRTDRPL